MSNPTERRHDLDALRVFACYLLFLFHVGMVFNPAPFFHVRNDETSLFFLIVCGFIGAVAHAALLPARGLVGGRLAAKPRRGALPARTRHASWRCRWWRAACSFMPVIKYLELRSGQDLNHRGLFVTPELLARMRAVIPIELPAADVFDESFLSFLPTFFTQLDRFTWSHLWFVAYLLVFTLVLLPVFVALARRGPGPAAIARAWVYVPILPLVVIQLSLRERFPGPYNLYSDWANVLFFVTFLGSGFAMGVVPAFEERVRSEWRRALALGAAATAVLLAAVLGVFQSTPVVLAGSAVAGWCFVVALLGFARERITRSGPRLRYLTESAFPIYVLHQPVVVVLGAAVVTLPLGDLGEVRDAAGGIDRRDARDLPLRRAPLRGAALRARDEAAASRLDAAPAAPATNVARWRTRRGVAPLLLLVLLLQPGAGEASALEPTGLWWAEGGAAQVEIAPCDDALCGRVAWLRSPFDERGCALRDVENPNPAQRARDVLGIDLLRNVRASPERSGEWSGEIYDPTSGRTYAAVLQMDGTDRLRVRGYLGIRLLGRTTTWLRVGTENQCREDV